MGHCRMKLSLRLPRRSSSVGCRASSPLLRKLGHHPMASIQKLRNLSGMCAVASSSFHHGAKQDWKPLRRCVTAWKPDFSS